MKCDEQTGIGESSFTMGHGNATIRRIWIPREKLRLEKLVWCQIFFGHGTV